MNKLTRLTRPDNHQIKFDPTPRDSLSDGFNYPTFRLLNKQTRLTLSPPLKPETSFPYRLLSVANLKGWFAAVKKENNAAFLILSPLHELRFALKAAKENEEKLFSPQRTLKLPADDVNIIAFGLHDTRLLVGFTRGQLMVYDTTRLLSPGTKEVMESNVTRISSAPFLQIIPNPSSEVDLARLVAIVRGDGVAQILDIDKLEAHGGWTGEGDSAPVAISWSPKGKQLAVGLRAGDIFTYAMNNKTVPHKQIPPTADAYLVSLDWFGPAHVFKTTYRTREPESSDATLHILNVDVKTSTGTYFNLMHPFPADGRSKMHAMTLHVPKWDEDAMSQTELPKSLAIVGDMCSVDLEVLAQNGPQWFQQSQENPVQLPLDKTQNDTILVSLESDLTDTEAGVPIMYTYLNDGTLQGWHLDFPKPYPGMVQSETRPTEFAPATSQLTAFSAPQQPSGFPSTPQQPITTSPFGPTTNVFAQPTTSPFAESPQQQPPASPFGQPVFGQPGFGSQATSVQQSPFRQSASSGFGNPPAPSTGFGTNGFGSLVSTGNSNVFGQPSFGFSGSTAPTQAQQPITREASMSDDTVPLGNLSLGNGNEAESPSKAGSGPFGPLAPSNSNTASVFNGGPFKPATGFGAFSNLQSQQTSNSGTDLKPAVGFGAFENLQAQLTTTSSSGSSGNLIKPATGFGAFSNFQASTSTFGSNTTTPPNAVFGAASTTNSASTAGQPVFGQSGFAKPAFGQPAFGQSGFGQPSFGKSSLPTSSGLTGGFGAFANNQSSSFLSAAKPAGESSGFGAYSTGSPTSFGAAIKDTGVERPKISPFASDPGRTALNSGIAKEPIFSAGTAKPGGVSDSGKGLSTPFQTSATRDSPPSSPEPMTATKPALALDDEMSPPTSPVKQGAGPISTTPSHPPPGNAFGSFISSSVKPASGFGAFGGVDASSPFFKKAEVPATPISVFGKPVQSTTPTTTPVSLFGKTAVSTTPMATPPTTNLGAPKFGSTSMPGAIKSAFTPIDVAISPTKTPAAGGFSSFSGKTGGFTAFAGSSKTFGELLKTRDDSVGSEKGKVEAKYEPVEGKGEPIAIPKEEPATPVTPKKEEEAVSTETLRTPVFTLPKHPVSTTPASDPPVTDKSKATELKEGLSKKTLSSEESFVEVTAEDSREDGEITEDEGDLAPTDSESSADGTDEEEEEGAVEGSEDETEKPIESRSTSVDPAGVPLPQSRSPSATPQSEATSIQVTPTAPSEKSPSNKEAVITSLGTTIKPPAGLFTKPSSAAPSSPSLGIGLGRPSTRPARSSPLASAPVSNADRDEDDGVTGVNDEKSTPESIPNPKPVVSPKPTFTTLPLKVESAEVKGSVLRSNTPPLLSTASTVKTVSEFPVIQPPPKSVSAPPTTPAQSATSLSKLPQPFLKPESTTPSGSPGNIFGNLSATYPQQGLFGGTTLQAVPGFLGTSPAAQPGMQLSSQLPFSFPSSSKPFGQLPSVPSTASANTPTKLPFSISAKSEGASRLDLSGQKPSSLSSLVAAPSGGTQLGLFGLVQKASSLTPPMTSSASQPPRAATAPPSGFFGQPLSLPSSLPTPAHFGIKGASLTPSLLTPKEIPIPEKPSSLPVSFPSPSAMVTPSASLAVADAPMEEGMQKECALLYNTMNQELEEIRTLALEANRKREQLGKSRYGSRQKQDLGDSAKWGLIDAVQFGNVLKQYKHDLLALKEQRDQLKQKVRQIQSRMLKAGTRKEEISRFTKAQSDKEFARMLKTRTLGPEHLETQAQLRKNIRMIRDRIQKLEANLSTYKKKLAEASSGKPSFRPPTLDTISRAYRNIGLAIQHKSDEVTELSARVAELKVTTPMKIIPSKRDPRLPDNDSRRPFNVTRHVAVTTAAALNAERSAQKLKKALLTVRKQPLLNKKAVHASAAPIAFKTPLKIESTTEERKIAENFFMTPIKGPLFDPVTTSPSSVPDLTFPEDEFEPSPSPSTRRGAGRTKKHSSVPLKRSTGTPPAAAAPTFDWGPLPTFNQPPLGGLPSPLKPTLDPPGFVSFAQFKK